MRIAVVGAGIAGVTTAHELALDGHEVTVFERRGGVAAEASFAHAGLGFSPPLTAWEAPGLPVALRRRPSALQLARLPGPALATWLRRWAGHAGAEGFAAQCTALHPLAVYSQQRLARLSESHDLAHEQGRGLLVLLRTPQDLTRAREGLKLLATLGTDFHLVDADEARVLEPALLSTTALRAAVHLPREPHGNGRQLAQRLKAEAQQRGVRFVFERQVRTLEAGPPLRLHHEAAEGAEVADAPAHDTFDAVVACAGADGRALLKPLGLKLPLQAVHGYSITAPLRRREGEPVPGPRLALVDEQFKAALTPLGDRLRVAGVAELGGAPADLAAPALDTLYRVLHDWFPGHVQLQHVQRWKGARATLPDGLPLIGAAAVPGLWLNLGHGDRGGALACGAARALADRIGGRAPALDLSAFAPDRPGLR
jgi:D-amino-acid dehydrogenase